MPFVFQYPIGQCVAKRMEAFRQSCDAVRATCRRAVRTPYGAQKNMRKRSVINSALGIARDLIDNRSGAALIEFALILPLFITLGLYGVEIAYMNTVSMQVSQIALSVADNASRLGQTDNSAVTPTIKETDIDAVMQGAILQGNSIGLQANGRIILSSLEYDDFTGKQYIHWQRCKGAKTNTSVYGNDTNNNGLAGGTISGVGSGSATITASSGSAVMVAEVYYTHSGIFGSAFIQPITFRQTANLIIRDDRNLTPGLTGGNSQSSC